MAWCHKVKIANYPAQDCRFLREVSISRIFNLFSVMENSPAGTSVIQVTAIDKDEGDLGIVSYEMNHPAFTIDMIDGTVTVLNSEFLDRETNPEMTVQILAKDTTKSTSVPLNITILDENDRYVQSSTINGFANLEENLSQTHQLELFIILLKSLEFH